MSIFLILLAAWLLLPALLLWSLASWSLPLALSIALALWLLSPLLLQLFFVRQVLHPMWHRPGTQPTRDDDATDAATQVNAAVSDAQAASAEDAFEAAVAVNGELGPVVGGAVPYYAGKITNPRVDFGLDYTHVSIRCAEGWKARTNNVEAAAAAPQKYGANGKRKLSDEPAVRNNVASAPQAAPRTYTLRAWHIVGQSLGGCTPRTLVVLVHGAGRDRRTFMRHTPVFFNAGYSTLLIDCREHGTSSATGKGMGFTTREAIDVIQAARYGREVLGYEKIVVCGTSQGAASSIVAAVLSEEIEFDQLPSRTNGAGVAAAPGSPASAARAAPRSRSRSYRTSTTRVGGEISDDEEDEQLLQSREHTPSPRSAAATPSSTPSTAAARVIDGVISENAFCSRESLISELAHHLLGRPPRFLAPLVAPLQDVFIRGIILLLRHKLGLLNGASWALNLRRSLGQHEMLYDFDAKRNNNDQRGITGRAHASPSSAHLPLPLLSSTAGSSPSQLLDLSPLDLVARISPRPLLLMHGLLDSIVAPSHSQSLFQAARDPKKLWLVADAHHTALVNADPEGWASTVLEWLNKNGF